MPVTRRRKKSISAGAKTVVQPHGAGSAKMKRATHTSHSKK
jgi:hypothetical protein